MDIFHHISETEQAAEEYPPLRFWKLHRNEEEHSWKSLVTSDWRTCSFVVELRWCRVYQTSESRAAGERRFLSRNRSGERSGHCSGASDQISRFRERRHDKVRRTQRFRPGPATSPSSWWVRNGKLRPEDLEFVHVYCQGVEVPNTREILLSAIIWTGIVLIIYRVTRLQKKELFCNNLQALDNGNYETVVIYSWCGT